MEKLKILIPTDFSVQAEYAFLMVKKLEEKIPVETHFLYVMNVPDTITMDKNGKIETCGDISVSSIESQKAIAERKLQNLKTLYGNDIHVHFDLGKVTNKIVLYAEENKFDMIVMGTKGAWGIKEKLSGSETQMVARHSKIPVLSLMCDRSDLIIQNILLVHDFSARAKLNLSLLHKLIQAFNTKVHLLQIAGKQNDAEKSAILQHMDEFAKLNSISNFEKHILNDQDVEYGVIHFNQMHDMDMVCIGTHGKGGLFHTSATEKLVNHLFKPIISYHLNS
jgi:nucleotide-binding universal stress UspA family protein